MDTGPSLYFRVDYLLQGLVVCKQCGYAYYGKPIKRPNAQGHERHYAYYRCTGSDASHFGGQRVCTNKPVRMDCLDQAVWQEVRSLMNNPQRLAHEYARRLQSFAQPSDDFKRLDLDKQLHQCRRGMSRLIDAYTGGFLDKDEFEPRIAHLKERRRALENKIQQRNDEALTSTELQLIIGRLDDFAAKVHCRLNDMEFMAKRELIRTLVKCVEIDKEQVNVVFRIGSTPTQATPSKNLQDCRRRLYWLFLQIQH